MQLGEDDANELKTWILNRLTGISDADGDLLADYTLALTRTNKPDPQLRTDISDSLEEFLKENTSAFVNDLFQAIESGAYKPRYIAPPLNHHSSAPQQPAVSAQLNPQSNLVRKRSNNDAGLGGPDPNFHYGPRAERQTKQMRGRGGRGGRGNGFDLRGGFQQNHGHAPDAHSGLSSLGMPHDPMAAILAMQAMGMTFGMEGTLPQQIVPHKAPGFNQNGGKELCQDYVNKGFCIRGDTCLFQHTNPVVVPRQQDEYDPKDSVINSDLYSPTSLASEHHLNNQPLLEGYSNESRGRDWGGDRGRGRGRGGNDRGGFRKPVRAEFSHMGPNYDRAITKIVVEQIPEEKFSEEAVREFFSEFGSIEEITIQPYKRLAIIKYSDYFGARAAYASPKVIFDNRFVKVYWYKAEAVPTPPADTSTPSNNDTPMKEDGHALDMEAFTATTVAAQAKLDAKKAALAAMHSKRSELEKQKADLAAKQAVEKQKLLDRLAAKGMAENSPSNDQNTMSKEGDSAHTLMLRAKVAELEAEAKSLGLSDSALSDSTLTWTPRGRGRGRGTRGSYRGWEGFDPAYRGSGRGGAGGGRGRGSVGGGKYNLDLRTKRVTVSLQTPNDTHSSYENSKAEQKGWTAGQDEALRQYLLAVGEFEDIHPLADGSAAAAIVVAFKDRGTAEGFLYGVRGKGGELPGVGRVDVGWFNGPIAPAATAVATKAAAAFGPGPEKGLDKENGDLNMGLGGDRAVGNAEGNGDRKDVSNENGVIAEDRHLYGELDAGEGEYDVAEEDEDSWMT